MKINTEIDKNALIVYLCGELDECAASEARSGIDAALDNFWGDSVVFDLSKLSFMDSTGIGVLIGRYKRTRDRHNFFVRNSSQTVDKIFKMAGLYNIMPKI